MEILVSYNRIQFPLTPVDFWCKLGLNSRYFIQLLETLPIGYIF